MVAFEWKRKGIQVGDRDAARATSSIEMDAYNVCQLSSTVEVFSQGQ